MIVNWPERLWCDSLARRLVQRREVAAFARLARLPSGATVLEIGCGNGAGAELFARAFDPALVLGVDVDPRMVKKAARRAALDPKKRLAFALADAQRLPLAEASVDAAVNFGIIHHLEDWRLGPRELGRVLKPGGIFFFEEIYPPLYANFLMKRLVAHPTHDRFHGPEFRAGLAAAGLTLLPGWRESRLGILGAARKTA